MSKTRPDWVEIYLDSLDEVKPLTDEQEEEFQNIIMRWLHDEYPEAYDSQTSGSTRMGVKILIEDLRKAGFK